MNAAAIKAQARKSHSKARMVSCHTRWTAGTSPHPPARRRSPRQKFDAPATQTGCDAALHKGRRRRFAALLSLWPARPRPDRTGKRPGFDEAGESFPVALAGDRLRQGAYRTIDGPLHPARGIHRQPVFQTRGACHRTGLRVRSPCGHRRARAPCSNRRQWTRGIRPTLRARSRPRDWRRDLPRTPRARRPL